MRSLLILLAALSGLIQVNAQNTGSKTYSVDQLLRDYDSLHAWIKAIHPKLYANADSTATELAWNRVRLQFDKPMTEWEFRNAVSPLVHQYNDAHTYIEVPINHPLFDSFTKRGGTFFPLPVKLFGDSVVVLPDSASGIPAGSLITRINGVNTNQLLKKIYGLTPGDNAANLAANCSRLFALLLWTAYNWSGTFEVSYKTAYGKKEKIKIEGIKSDAYFKRLFPSPLWTMKLHPAESLAVIECTGYSGNMDRIRHKLDSFFSIIKQQNIRHVALDLRRNGGGNSFIGELFLSFVNNKPYEAVRSKSYRASWAVKNLPETDWRKKDMDAFIKNAVSANGYFTQTYKATSTLPFPKPDSFFDGSFYLLTSARTYSSAHITAMQVKCGKLGTIIGQPTGEHLDLTGEIKDFKLPHTGVEVWIPMAMFTAACPASQKIGVQPDHFVAETITDAAKGIDAELEFLKTLIGGKN